MKLLLLLFLLYLKYAAMIAAFPSPGCCYEKQVGTERYVLVSEDDTTTAHNDCDSNCVYEKKTAPSSRYCFKAGNDTFHCRAEQVEPVYPIWNEIKIEGSHSKQIMTVESYKYGHASVARACGEASKGGEVYIQGSLIMTGVSSTSVQKKALKISEYLKTEYKEEFKHEVTNVRFGGSAVWKWLGISASGEYSDEVVDKYEFGESSLKAAREEFTSSFDQTLEKQIEVQIKFTVKGRTPIPTKVCAYIQVEEIKFTDSTKQHVATNDAGTTECVDPDGQSAQCKNKKLVIIDLD